MKRTVIFALMLLLCLAFSSVNAMAAEEDDASEASEAEEFYEEEIFTESMCVELVTSDTMIPECLEQEETDDEEGEAEPAEGDGKDEPAGGDAVETAGEEGKDEPADVCSAFDITVGEDENGVTEYTVSGSDIDVGDGTYNYELVIRETGEVTFDNDLTISYQGVDGQYSMHYEIDEADNHTMIVSGFFKNIITESPLLQRIRDRVSDDSYSYELDLRTSEGFTFTNTLSFLLDEERYGYSMIYSYDLATDSQTFVVEKIEDETIPPADDEKPGKKLLAALKSLLTI